MTTNHKEAPRLRWNDKDELISDALFQLAWVTAKSLLIKLKCGEDLTLYPLPSRLPLEEMRDRAEYDAQRLLDLAALYGSGGTHHVLTGAWDDLRRDEEWTDPERILDAARKLLTEVDATPAKRGEA